MDLEQVFAVQVFGAESQATISQQQGIGSGASASPRIRRRFNKLLARSLSPWRTNTSNFSSLSGFSGRRASPVCEQRTAFNSFGKDTHPEDEERKVSKLPMLYPTGNAWLKR